MSGLALEQIQDVRHQIEHGRQCIDGATRIARYIKNYNFPADSANAATEHRIRRFLAPSAPHFFGHAIQDAAANGPRRFRRDVSRRDACAASGDNEFRPARQLYQQMFNLRLLIGNDLLRRNLETCFSQSLRDGGSGKVGSVAPRA